ncbi:MAG: hypothetical protein ACYCYF_01715 [Anaerolineae bacterium]
MKRFRDKMRVRRWAWLAAAALLLSALVSPSASAQGSIRVGLVVDHGDGTVVSMIVTVSDANPTGYQVLQQSGLELLAQSSGMGVAICSIADTGCPTSNCFCDSPPNNWTYWHLNGDTWVYSPTGAGSYRVADGAVEGWRWGPGDPPPVMTFGEIEAGETSAAHPGDVSAQQAYPGPETPVVLDPGKPFDPYPGPGEPTQTAVPYPGPEEPTATVASATPQVGASATAPRATITLRPTYTLSVAGTPRPLSGTPAAPSGPVTGPTPTSPSPAVPLEGPLSTAAAAGEPSQTSSPTADRVAILISTAVARDKQAGEGVTGALEVRRRSYAGFAVLALCLLCLVGYVYLLRRQRRMRPPGTP